MGEPVKDPSNENALGLAVYRITLLSVAMFTSVFASRVLWKMQARSIANRICSVALALGLLLHHMVRVSRAMESLRSGQPISTSAIEAGFFDQSHLTKHFKRVYGVTPGEFQGGIHIGNGNNDNAESGCPKSKQPITARHRRIK